MTDVFDEDRSGDFSVLRSLGIVTLPPLDRVAAAGVVPIDVDTGRMVSVLLDRGIDFPGGHRQDGDPSIEAVARRECLEEAAVDLGPMQVIDVVESTYFGSAPQDLTYMVIFTGAVARSLEFRASAEVFGREEIVPSDFLNRYRSGDAVTMERWLRAAFDAMSTPWR